MARRPRPWAMKVDHAAGRLYARMLSLLFFVLAAVCASVAIKIWNGPGGWERPVGFVLVVLAGVTCFILALRSRKIRSLEDWVD